MGWLLECDAIEIASLVLVVGLLLAMLLIRPEP